MADAIHAPLQLAQSRTERQIEAFVDQTPYCVGIDAGRKIESSCCGMAGSFGYEAHHYDVSLRMAELSLLPAIRKASNAIVVADGTSCRHQIADGTSREALHVARLLESLLV